MKLKGGRAVEHRNLRTKDVAQPEPTSELVFDPERDVTPQDVKALLQAAQEGREQGAHSYVTDQAFPLTLLAYDQEPQLSLTDEELAFEEVNVLEYGHKIVGSRIGLFPNAITRYATLIRPERRAKPDFWVLRIKLLQNLDPKLWSEAERVVGVAKTAFELRLLFPGSAIKLPQNFFSQIRQEIIRRQAEFDLFNNIPVDLVIYAKTLYPDEDLDLPEIVNRLAIQQLQALAAARKEDDHYQQFRQQLTPLLLLTADKIQVTLDGKLRITKPKAKTTGLGPKLPARTVT